MKHSIDHDAAGWAITLRDPQASFEDIDRALNWINSTADRKAAFDRAERFLITCDEVSSNPTSRASLLEQALRPDATSKITRWSPAIAASIALLVTGLASLLINRVPVQQPAAPVRYASAVGEVRTVPLPDGSMVTLGGSSAITVAFNSKARRITITDGEAYFNVASDRKRPFVVAAGSGTTTAVGTAFNVHRQSNGTTVTVVHGVVEVISRKPQFLMKRRLGRAMQVSYSSDARMGPVGYVNLQTTLGWRQGELNFYNQPLGAVVADLNRYSSSPITIDGDELRLIPITGVARTDGILEWLQALASVMNFEVVQHSDRTVLRTSYARAKGSVAIQSGASDKNAGAHVRH